MNVVIVLCYKKDIHYISEYLDYHSELNGSTVNYYKKNALLQSCTCTVLPGKCPGGAEGALPLP